MKLRRSTLPPEVAARVDGRPLASAQAADGTWIVGTRAALVLVGAGSSHPIPWERLEGAHWDRDSSRLRCSEVGRFGEPRPAYSFTMPETEPSALLQLIRERVTASVVLQRGRTIAGKRGLKVIGRRSPVGGPIAWMHEYDEGIDPDDPEVVAAAQVLLEQARADVGE
ncbi:MAG TPA: hypothetical protein VHO29_07405 [Marmoricola sp.]|nr:hypothetical protein [Marmoricola sp.]